MSVQDIDREQPPPSPPPPITRPLHDPPPLTATGSEATAQGRAFVTWAGRSLPSEEEDIRNALDGARDNADIVQAFADEVVRSQTEDWSRTLVALTLLGSLRNRVAEPFLIQFARQPLPASGTFASEGALPDDEPIEASSLAILQSVAVDGLALVGSASANAEVVRVAAEHPSLIVRAEAIRAYLASRGSEGRQELEQRIRSQGRIFLDRFERRNAPGSDSTFDDRLRAFLARHPEAGQTVPEEAQR